MRVAGGSLFGATWSNIGGSLSAAIAGPGERMLRIEEVSMHKIEISPAVMDRVNAWRGRTHMFDRLLHCARCGAGLISVA